LFPGCEVLDVAGPLQTFHEANACGANYRIRMVSSSPQIAMAQPLMVAGLAPLPEVHPGDLVIVPGFDLRGKKPPAQLGRWLRQALAAGAHVCAVCTGAFALGEAGLLEHRSCTTHWKRVDELQRGYPQAKVLHDRLFVTDGNVTTSAGVASGIDMALWLIEQDYGPVVTARVAREMVVYVRRDGSQTQESIYLDYRTHLNSGIHRVQDYLVANVEKKVSIAELARIARMSTRTLTRVFRAATGLSIAEFRSKARLETAKMMLHDPDVTIEATAERAGFSDPRHFRRVWKQAFGVPPSRSKRVVLPLRG
jgi:transcriptional regulator GlxA family with amidase domain